MRFGLLVLLLLAPVQGAILEDAQGDVVADHCQQADTPVAGFEAMDLLTLDINETPDDVAFTVTAAGLEQEADYDAGNYFIYLSRLNTHYNIRLAQGNTGTGAFADLSTTETPGNPFGTFIAELPANIDASTNSITAHVPRSLLVDSDGAEPSRGQSMSGIIVSAEAHATGVYACGFDGSTGGPYIVEDQMPDGLDPADGAEHTFRYGGGIANGPIRMDVDRPFRASNGEATMYAFRVAVHNQDDVTHRYVVDDAGMPPDWFLVHPSGLLELEPDRAGTFWVYLQVPFQHQHGTTVSFDLQVRADDDPTIQATRELGVHYLETAQPSGHHPDVWLHTTASVGFPAGSQAGEGENHMFWNTLEEDERDQGVGVTARTLFQESAYEWRGCLGPRLAMGLSPGNGTGRFELQFEGDVPVTGTLSGTLYHVQPDDRGAYCTTMPSDDATPLMSLAATAWTAGTLEGDVSLVFDEDIPYETGGDVLLVLRLDTDAQATPQAAPKLTGGRLHLPLDDYHEPIQTSGFEDEGEEAPFVPEPVGETRDSPAVPVVWLLLAATAVAMRRRHTR